MFRFSTASILLLASSFAVAQDAAVVGKWSGSHRSGTDTTMRVVLDINSVDGETVKGTGALYSTARRPSCAGEYPIEGTLKANELRVRSTGKGGPGGDCAFNLTGTVEGNKILAKRGQAEFEMTK